MSVTLWNTVTVTQTMNMNTFIHLIPSSLSAPRNLSFLLQSCFNSLSVNYSWELTSVCSGSETSPPLLSRQTRDTSSLILRQTSTSFHPIMWVVVMVLMVVMVVMVVMVMVVVVRGICPPCLGPALPLRLQLVEFSSLIGCLIGWELFPVVQTI